MCQHLLTNLLRSIDMFQPPCAPTIVTVKIARKVIRRPCQNECRRAVVPLVGLRRIPTITSTLRALLALPRIATEAKMAIVEVVIFA
jgi:hypothetical protein